MPGFNPGGSTGTGPGSGVTGGFNNDFNSLFGGGGDRNNQLNQLNPLANQFNPAAIPGQQGFGAPQFGNFADAGNFGMNQAASLYGQGPVDQFQGSGVAGFGDSSVQAQQGMQNFGGPSNPFMQGFQNFANMQNPFLDQQAQIGQDQIANQVNSLFGGSGRGMSGQHVDTLGRQLGNFQTNLRGNAFDSMQNRNLQALGRGSNAYANQYNQGLNYQGDLLDVGRSQDLMSQLQRTDEINRFDRGQNAQWGNLQKFQDVVAGLNPTQPAARNKSSGLDKILGLGSLLGGFGVFG